MIVWSTGAGAGMASSLQMVEAEYRAFYTKKGWNDIVRAALHEAGNYWVKVDLPKRFTQFAIAALGYADRGSRGRGGTEPLVVTGRLRAFLLARAYPEARATSSRYQIILRLPVPTMLQHSWLLGDRDTGILYTANPVVAKVLRRITDEELAKMGEIMGTVIKELISGSATKVNRRLEVKMSLTTAQRASIAHTVKAQGSIHRARPSIAK